MPHPISSRNRNAGGATTSPGSRRSRSRHDASRPASEYAGLEGMTSADQSESGFVYVLRRWDDQDGPFFYVGQTRNLCRRLAQHSNAQVPTTAQYAAHWKLFSVKREEHEDLPYKEIETKLKLTSLHGIKCVSGSTRTTPEDVRAVRNTCNRCGNGDHYAKDCPRTGELPRGGGGGGSASCSASMPHRAAAAAMRCALADHQGSRSAEPFKPAPRTQPVLYTRAHERLIQVAWADHKHPPRPDQVRIPYMMHKGTFGSFEECLAQEDVVLHTVEQRAKQNPYYWYGDVSLWANWLLDPGRSEDEVAAALSRVSAPELERARSRGALLRRRPS